MASSHDGFREQRRGRRCRRLSDPAELRDLTKGTRLVGPSTSARIGVHHISYVMNERIGHVCLSRFEDAQINQSSSKTMDQGSRREVLREHCRSGTSASMFSRFLDSNKA